MEALFNRLQIEAQSELEVINPNGSPVKGYDQKMKVIKLAIMKLRQHLKEHPFIDKATEIKYFKHWRPFFCRQYIYFSVLYQLECTRITCDAEAFSSYLENEKSRIAAFLLRYRELYLYFLLDKSDKDELLFVRTPLPETGDFVEKEENSCHESLILSELQAYNDYKKVLDEEIELATVSKKNNFDDKLKYIGTKAEAVELITLIYEAKLFDNTLEQLIVNFESDTNTDLKDFTRIDNNNRMRKKSTNPLLDKFIDAAKKRIKRLNP